jgi:hypothetical protein
MGRGYHCSKQTSAREEAEKERGKEKDQSTHNHIIGSKA